MFSSSSTPQANYKINASCKIFSKLVQYAKITIESGGKVKAQRVSFKAAIVSRYRIRYIEYL